MNTKDNREEQRLLDLLDVVGQRSDVSQRHLARQMGVALGLANSYLRRCVRKGLVKITSAPANRYLYYLTPKGFSEKSRLTAKYLSTSLEFYRRAGQSCLLTLRECETRGWRRILLCGGSDLAEIALLRAMEMDLEVVGVIDRTMAGRKFLGRPVCGTVKEAGRFDCCIVTDLRAPQETSNRLAAEIGPERVLVPDILKL